MNFISLLLLTAVIIFACVILNNFSSRIGIPYLLLFILLGMLFGSDGLFRIEFDNLSVTRDVCSAALIFIMFYGGFGTNWNRARKRAAPSVALASAGVAGTAVLTGVFSHFALGLPLLESMILGSAVSSTDAASVFSILRSRKLNLRDNTASILEMESGSNDPFSYLMTNVCILIAAGSAGPGGILSMALLQIVLGILFGAGIALAGKAVLQKIHFANDGFNLVFVFGIAVLSYALPERLGGNGYLSTYIVGIVIGNADIPGKKELVHFFDGLTDICQMLIFFLLGLLSFPSRLPSVALPACILSLFMILVARPAVVFALGRPFGMRLPQILLISWAGLRGASSIVFAIMAVTELDLSFDLFHMVFFVVLISILLQGSLLPKAAEKLNMIDESEDVMKTFNDYSEERPVEFIRIRIPAGHPFAGQTLSEAALPPGTLAVMLERGGTRMVPEGTTRMEAGDELILTAPSAGQEEILDITEIPVDKESPFLGKALKDISRENGLIIQIIRENHTLIPDGQTRIREGDLLILHRGK